MLPAAVRDLVGTLATLRARVPSLPAGGLELVLAENGSSDGTAALAAALAAELGPAPVDVVVFSLGEPNYGKALRRGIAMARGELVICEEIDLCDHDFHARALTRLTTSGCQFVVGSKAMAGAHDQRPLIRRVGTKVITRLLRVATGFRGTDTHGLKAFRRSVVAPLAAACVVDKDLFASELVIRAHRAGLRVEELPVRLAEKRPPAVRLASRVPAVLRGLITLAVAVRRQAAAVDDCPEIGRNVADVRQGQG